MSAAAKQFESLEINPKLGSLTAQFLQFCKHAESQLQKADNQAEVLQILRTEVSLPLETPETEVLAELFACNVVLDLVAQGWELRVNGSRVRLRPPFGDKQGHSSKDLVRKWHL